MSRVTTPLIRTFSSHYREKYGQAIGKIPLDLGIPCPNRTMGGCIFCRPSSFTPGYLQSTDSINRQVERGKASLLASRFRVYFAYFQQETATALPPEELLPVCRQALRDPDCLGLIFSTRPDYVDQRLLDLLAELVEETGKDCLFELGLQSIHTKSLQLLNRNHSYQDFTDAVHRIMAMGCFEIGVHLILGIPGESEAEMRTSVEEVCGHDIRALKLHHLQVITGTPLHAMYDKGRVPVFTRQGYLQLLVRLLPLIPADVVLHRLWATAHPAQLIAPKWGVLAAELSGQLQRMMEQQGVYQGSKLSSGAG